MTARDPAAVPALGDTWIVVLCAQPSWREGATPGNLARVRIVRSGRWLYDGSVDKPVDVIALDFDFWFEIGRADDRLEPGEVPQPLGPDGCLYYVRFRHAGEVESRTWVDGGGHPTIEQAMAEAQEKAPTEIRWASPH